MPRTDASIEPVLELRHVVHHRGQIERHQLREDQSAHHHETERLSRFTARAVAQCDRHRPQQRRQRGHHDRPEANQAAFVNRLPELAPARSASSAKSICMMAFFDNADQHDHADERIDIQIHPEEDQRDEGAEPGRWQAGKKVIGGCCSQRIPSTM
jgi:hypothetical protein